MPLPPADAPATLTRRDRVFALAGVLLALFLGALDQTIVSTALPRIVDDLRGVDRYAWVATAYLLASTAMVPIYGKLADLMSRRRIELVAIGLFLAGSMLCGLAGEFGPLPLVGDGMNQLIAARALQGLGGAGLFAMAFIVIADLFPPAERGKYQGLVGAVFGVASVLGPVVGGFLTDHGGGLIEGVSGWRWVFYVNVPFGALALWFVARRMPPLVPPARGRLDVFGAALLVGGLVPLVLGLQLDKRAHPWTSPVTLALFVGAALGLALFTWRSLRSADPLLDLGLFRNRLFSAAIAALFFLGAAFIGLIVFLPLFLTAVAGASATGAGVALIPLTMGIVVGSTVSGQLVSRKGRYKPFMVGGGLLLGLGTFLLTTMSAEASVGTVVFYALLCGLGIGPAFPLYTLAIQNAVDARRLGQATSTSQFSRQIGGVVGAALMGTVLTLGLAGAPPAVHASAPTELVASEAPAVASADETADTALAPTVAPAAVRQAYADALRPVFQIAFALVVLGWIATLFVPELPLRRHFEESSGLGTEVGVTEGQPTAVTV